MLKKILIAILAILAIAVIWAYASGNDHLISAMPKTYLVGKTGPTIDDLEKFEYETLPAGEAQPWPMYEDYNKQTLSTAARDYFENIETAAYLVLKDGKLVYEEYWDDYSKDSHTNSFSMAKSIVSMAVGVAYDEGFIKNLDDKASDYINEFKNGPNQDVTIRQLLQMRSNINFDEHYKNPLGFMAKAYYGDDLINKTLEYEVKGTPGSEWAYLGGNTLLLAIIVERTTGKSIHEYVDEKLWQPMGAEHQAYWSLDEADGFEKAYCCFYSNARDFARFGQLFLCNGNWKGKQLISSQYIDESLSPFTLDDAAKTPINYYGYQWWLGQYRDRNLWMMRGIQGQYVIIVPEEELVVVRLGNKRPNERKNHIPLDVYEYIDEALKITGAE